MPRLIIACGTRPLHARCLIQFWLPRPRSPRVELVKATGFLTPLPGYMLSSLFLSFSICPSFPFFLCVSFVSFLSLSHTFSLCFAPVVLSFSVSVFPHPSSLALAPSLSLSMSRSLSSLSAIPPDVRDEARGGGAEAPSAEGGGVFGDQRNSCSSFGGGRRRGRRSRLLPRQVIYLRRIGPRRVALRVVGLRLIFLRPMGPALN